jgi:Putative zinc-finger
MRCGDRASLLRYYGAGNKEHELRPEERRRIEEHLAACSRCSQLGRTLAPLAGLVGAELAAPLPRQPGCPQPEILTDYFHRRLPRWSRARVRSHLLACERCLRSAHELAAAPEPSPRRAPAAGGARRRLWVPVVIAAPGYLLALLALTGRLPHPQPSESPPRPGAEMVRLPAAPPPSATSPGVVPGSAVVAQAPPIATAGGGQSASGTRPPTDPLPSHRRARPAAGASHGRSRPGETPVALPVRENPLPVQAIDLAIERCPAARAGLVRARELVAADRLPEAAGVLETVLAGDAGRDSLAVGACLALIHLADPGRDQLALAALSRSLGTDDPDPEDDQAIRIVQNAANLAPRDAERTIRSVQAYQEGGELPFEALLLAGIVLDQPAYRDQSRTVLRAARKWLDRDLKAREQADAARASE